MIMIIKKFNGNVNNNNNVNDNNNTIELGSIKLWKQETQELYLCVVQRHI